MKASASRIALFLKQNPFPKIERRGRLTLLRRDDRVITPIPHPDRLLDLCIYAHGFDDAFWRDLALALMRDNKLSLENQKNLELLKRLAHAPLR